MVWGRRYKAYSWADGDAGKANLKVYVDLPEGCVLEEGGEEKVTVDFQSRGLDLIIPAAPIRVKSGADDVMAEWIYRCKIEPLEAEILPEQSTFKVAFRQFRFESEPASSSAYCRRSWPAYPLLLIHTDLYNFRGKSYDGCL